MFDKRSGWEVKTMRDLPSGEFSEEDRDVETGNGERARNDSASQEPAFTEFEPLDSGSFDSSPPDPGSFDPSRSDPESFTPDSPEEDGPPQGMWLTATAWLPPDLLSAMAEGSGAGFGQGGVLDEMPPGPALTTFTAEAVGGIAGTGLSAPDPRQPSECPPTRLRQLSDDNLIGVIRSYRKQASAAQAGELAAVSELASRRHAAALADGVRDSIAADAATDEVAAALTLTGRAAQVLTDRAVTFQDLPGTFAALATGRIDMPKALVLLTGLAGQEPALVHAVEAAVIDRAAAQTTGQLRASLNRALLAADPAAAEKRRQTEEKLARIEQTPEPGGVTAALTGRYLPVTAAVAAWNRISELARQLKTAGATGNLDELRVQVFLALLNGHAIGTSDGSPPPADWAQTSSDGDPADTGGDGALAQTSSDGDPADTGGDQAPAETSSGASSAGGNICSGEDPDGVASGEPGAANSGAAGTSLRSAGLNGTGRLTGTVNLTVPLATLLGLGDAPGELGAFGPITAYTAREIGAAALEAPAVRWCVTVTNDDGVPVGHGCARPHARRRRATGRESGEWAFTVKLRALALDDCRHERENGNYRPPPWLRHLIQIRNQRCTYAGCRIAAGRCDDDHTTPFDKGGRTCECNLAPLCRHHHRVKQLEGWRLEQPEPGVLAWVTPSGWKYITGPTMYAA